MVERLLPVGRLLLLMLAMTIVVVSFCGTPLTEAATRGCVTALVRSPYRLPDGKLQPAGRLTVCRARTYSPIAELHLVTVDRRPMGMFLSRSGRAEGTGTHDPEIVFRREPDGSLSLLGYTVPTRGRSLVHRLLRPSPGGSFTADETEHGLPVVAALAR